MTTYDLVVLEPQNVFVKLPRTQVKNIYADSVNQQFDKQKSHYVKIDQRSELVLGVSWLQNKINFAISQFRSNYKTIIKFSELRLVRTNRCKLSDIDIDVTLQRMVDGNHLCNILTNFRELLVMPICVYVDRDNPGRYVCWDGQHTVIALYIIACKILQQDINDIDIPICIYESELKSEMRMNFITLGGEGKKPLEQIDLFHQMVYGVRTDNSANPAWKLAERKQAALESHGMFATHTKFQDTHQPGAMSNLTEFMESDLELVEVFCEYFAAVCNSSRPVESKEAWMLMMYFAHAKSQGIDIKDPEYIAAVATCLNTGFPNGFDPDKLFERAKLSYEKWWKKNKPNPDGTILGIQRHKKHDTLCFLIEQIRKYMTVMYPEYSVPHTKLRYNKWQVPAEDLF